MMSKIVKETLCKDISKWKSEGWIDNNIYDILSKRYEVIKFGFDRILKYLGIVGGIILLFSIIGIIGITSQSIIVGIIFTMAFAIGSFALGLHLHRDLLNRYPFSARVLFFSSLLFYGGVLALTSRLFDMNDGNKLLIMGLLWLIPSFIMAYYYVNSFILVIAVLTSFHWFGSWHKMFGQSSYVFSVQDPNAMIVFALVVFVSGILHDLFIKEKFKGFYKVYSSISLLYLNMSILILSIWDTHKLAYIVAGFIISLIQIIIGAHLQRVLFTGFGVTFLGIHMLTRYHELFWDKWHKGAFFLIGGIVLLSIGIFFEWINKKKMEE